MAINPIFAILFQAATPAANRFSSVKKIFIGGIKDEHTELGLRLAVVLVNRECFTQSVAVFKVICC